jgi:hypothetical protein
MDVLPDNPPTDIRRRCLFQSGLRAVVVRQSPPVSSVCPFLLAVLELSPTEASVERLFSAVKWQVTKHRKSCLPQIVEAYAQVSSAVRFLKLDEFTNEDSNDEASTAEETPEPATQPVRKAHRTEGTEVEPDVIEKKISLTMVEVLAEVFVMSVTGQRAEAASAEPPSRFCAAAGCAAPGKLWSKHEHLPGEVVEGVVCGDCGRRFAFQCLGVSEEAIATIRTQRTWQCWDCLGTRAL